MPAERWGEAEFRSSPTLAKLRASGIVTIGHRSSSLPFSYLDARLQPIGFTVDLCRRIVEDLRALPDLRHLTVRWMPVTSATRMPLVANGSIDLECGTTTHTVERARQVGFSVTYLVAASRLMSRQEQPVRTIEDLRGQRVVTTIGTTSMQILQTLNRDHGMRLHLLGGLDDVDSLRLLDSGRAVAFAMDDVLLRGLLADGRDASPYLLGSFELSVEPYALMFRKGDLPFKRLVDASLVRIFKSGEYLGLYRTWFESPVPPAGRSLNLPLHPAMKRLLERPTDSPDPAAYR
jgi:glutamate/aspartate transport system substrate-binding protein